MSSAPVKNPRVSRGPGAATATPVVPPTILPPEPALSAPLLLNYPDLYLAGPLQRIATIKEGVQARRLGELSAALGRPQEWLMQLLDLPRTTINRKIRNDQVLTTDQSERVLGLARLIGQVAAMVLQSGDPAGFNAAAWVSDWIEQPNPALGNRRPAEFMDTLAGQEVLAGLLAQMQTGAYA